MHYSIAMTNKNITEFTVVELKALAYDQLATIEVAQNNLKAINQEFAARNQPAVETKEAAVDEVSAEDGEKSDTPAE